MQRRRRRNRIQNLKVEEDLSVDNQNDIQNAFLLDFKDLYTSKETYNLEEAIRYIPKLVTDQQNIMLLKIVD